jgi:hypothetical protein
MLVDVMAPTSARLSDGVVLRCIGDDRIVAQAAAFKARRYAWRCEEPEPSACRPLVGGAVSLRGAPAGVAGAGGPTPVVGWWEAGKARNHWSVGERPALITGSDPDERMLAGMGVVLLAAVDLAGLDLGEAMWSITRGGAMATGDGERGWIHLGGPADVMVLDGDDVRELVQRPDADIAWTVVANGVEL